MRRSGALVFTLIPVLLVMSDSRAEFPEWAKEIAESAPDLPEGIPPHHERILFDEVRYTVLPDGELQVRRRLATQAVGTRTDEVSVGAFAFDDTAQVRTSRAWHVPPGKKKGKRDWFAMPMDVTLQDGFLSDTKVRLIGVDGVRKGSIVFFEFEAYEKPYFLSLSHLFYEDVPVHVARLQIETPPGWAVRWEWNRPERPDAVVEGTRHTWELRNLDVFEEAELGLAAIVQAPLLFVQVVPPAGLETIPAIFADWNAYAAWYHDLARDRIEVTPEIEQEAARALEGAGNGRLATVRALAKHVRDRIRYLAVELGIGGYQPRPASATLDNLYGDCKDKATLLQSLLAARGVESYPVLVNLSNPGMVADAIPVARFNHLVVAVPMSPETPIPPEDRPSIIDGGDLGSLMIIDATDDKTSIGSRSAFLAGKKALVVTGKGGRIVYLPNDDPGAHRIERRIAAELRPDGTMTIRRASSYSGQFASLARSDYGTSATERRRGLDSRILEIWPDATVRDYQVELETAEGRFVETVEVLKSSHGSDGRLELFPGAGREVWRVPLGERSLAVDYSFPMTIRYDVSFRGLREHVAPPAARRVAGDGWSIETAFERDGETLRATLEIRINRTRFEPGDFQELRRLWSSCTAASRAVASLT